VGEEEKEVALVDEIEYGNVQIYDVSGCGGRLPELPSYEGMAKSYNFYSG